MAIKVVDEITKFSQCKTSSYTVLSDEGKVEYEKVCRDMIAKKTLRGSDLPVISAYAQSMVDIVEANKSIDDLGLILKEHDKNGNPKYNPNPAVKIKRDAEKQVANIALMLGFTPLGRKRIKPEDPIGESPLDNWIKENQ